MRPGCAGTFHFPDNCDMPVRHSQVHSCILFRLRLVRGATSEDRRAGCAQRSKSEESGGSSWGTGTKASIWEQHTRAFPCEDVARLVFPPVPSGGGKSVGSWHATPD